MLLCLAAWLSLSSPPLPPLLFCSLAVSSDVVLVGLTHAPLRALELWSSRPVENRPQEPGNQDLQTITLGARERRFGGDSKRVSHNRRSCRDSGLGVHRIIARDRQVLARSRPVLQIVIACWCPADAFPSDPLTVPLTLGWGTARRYELERPVVSNTAQYGCPKLAHQPRWLVSRRKVRCRRAAATDCIGQAAS